MGLFVQRDEKRSELQERVAASLRDKAAREHQIDQNQYDDVKDSAYMKDYKSTTSLAWVWLVIAIAVIAALVYLIIRL